MRAGTEDMWRVVHIAHSSQNADAAEQLLRAEGFLVQRQALESMVGGSGTFEIRVLKSEASEARNLLAENGF